MFLDCPTVRTHIRQYILLSMHPSVHPMLRMQHLRNNLTEFHNICHKHPLGCWTDSILVIKGHILGYNARIHMLILANIG